MPSDGWVASDATKYTFHDERPNWISLAAVAIAVDDVNEYNREYIEIVEGKCEEYGIETCHPLIKNEDVNRWVSDWERDEARRDIVTTLLQIETIREIQFVETSLDPMWITVFEDKEDSKRRINSQEFMNNYLEKYYNIIAIWEYLRKKRTRPEHLPYSDWPIHRNVMTDDFGGHINEAWIDVGDLANEIRVIPQGDKTYPLLSLADLTMNMVKQEVPTWDEQDIYEYLRDVTPDDSAWVDSIAIDHGPDLAKMVPHLPENIRTILHYPQPKIYIEVGDALDSDKARSLDIFQHVCRFALESGGCVKFFNENHDRDYMAKGDYLITLGDNAGSLRDYEELNDQRRVKVLNRNQAKEFLDEQISAYQ